MNKISIWIVALVLLVACKNPQPRYPISQSSGTFLKESAIRNKKLVKDEEQIIDSVMKANPQNQYLASQKGYWYFYNSKNETDTKTPQKGDVAFFDYEIKDIKGNIIYSKEELQHQTYMVDKQNIITGLQDGIKLMRKNETVTFYFPSHMAYGYRGDTDKIGTNQPIICTVTLTDFKPSAPKETPSIPLEKTTTN